MKFIDMHTHSTFSDGVYSPSKLVDYAVEKGLSGIAITDHDTIDGIEEAIERANMYQDFIIIPGIELSTEYNNEEVHILGYMIDYKMEYLLKILQRLQDTRNDRAIKIINKLKRQGIKINYGDVIKIAGDGVVGRPHIAHALIKKNYVQTVREAFMKYLTKGASAYVPKQKLTPGCAVNIIRKAGGFPVAAHPGLLKSEAILDYLISLGIDGIEVYHPKHTTEQSEEYLRLAKKHNLVITGGSDFHFPPKNNKHNSNPDGDLGSIKVPLESVEKLLK
ncbi:MAG: PHP domain-containing protein [Candidatus Alkaliphilus sp. MAG34]|nr:PHP domain-containing protein [Clostridiales bacterium]